MPRTIDSPRLHTHIPLLKLPGSCALQLSMQERAVQLSDLDVSA